MTTGTRLKNKSRIWPVLGLLTSTTLWFAAGNFTGWYVGQAGGFDRGIRLTSDLVLRLLSEKDQETVASPRRYKDI